MNIFSYCLTLLIGLCVADGVRHKNIAAQRVFLNLFILTAIITLTLNYGYFLKIGSFELGYDEVCCGALFLSAVILIIKKQYDKTIVLLCGFFVFFDVIAILIMELFPYISTGFISYSQSWDDYCYGRITLSHYFSISSSTFMIPLRFMIFFVVLSVIKKVFDQKCWDKVLKIYFLAAKIYIVYGIIEFVLKNLFGFDIGELLLTPIFGLASSTYSSLAVRGDSYIIQGLFRETSYFSAFLFVAAFSFCIKIKSTKKGKVDNVWFAIALILMLISGSFSSLLFAVIDIIVYLICVSKKRNGAFIVLVSVIIATLFIVVYCIINSIKLEYYFERLTNTFDVINSLLSGKSIGSVTSEGVRFTSIFNLISLWLHYPLFGVGYGTAQGHSALFWMLSNGGIVEMALWYNIVFRKTLKVKTTNIFIIMFSISLIFTLNLMQFYSISNIIFFYLICETTVKKGNKTAKIECKKGFNA